MGKYKKFLDRQVFKHYVSLGGSCHVAASMAKLGIRNFSGPFDWYISPLRGVLQCLDMDFDGFLSLENLKVSDNQRTFIDTKYEFNFPHEIKRSLEADYDEIYEKYQKRISRFRTIIKEPTCFIRSTQEHEIPYIKENRKWIDSIIKRSNSENEIIYIVQNVSESHQLSYPFFAAEYQYVWYFNRRSLRTLFDSNAELRNFLVEHYSDEERKKNLFFDLQEQNKTLEIVEYRYELMIQIEQISVEKIDIPQNVVIYGAGNLGKALCRKLSSVCRVKCMVDRLPKEKDYEGIPVVRYDDFIRNKEYTNMLVIITPVYSLDEISFDLSKAGVRDFISVEEYFNK